MIPILQLHPLDRKPEPRGMNRSPSDKSIPCANEKDRSDPYFLAALPADRGRSAGSAARKYGSDLSFSFAPGILLSDGERFVPRGSGFRSEERRVGKEFRSRWSPYH